MRNCLLFWVKATHLQSMFRLYCPVMIRIDPYYYLPKACWIILATFFR